MRLTKLLFFGGLIAVLFLFWGTNLRASHTVGGEMTYAFVQDSVRNGVEYEVYTVTLLLYQDCNFGDPIAIQDDNPVFFTVYENGGKLLVTDKDIFYDATPGSDGAIDLSQQEIVTDCGSVSLRDNSACLLRKKFTKTYLLPQNTAGYVVVYQRCCRTGSVTNLIDAGNNGVTFFCTIPGGGTHNSSAVFKEYPTPVLCMNNRAEIDVSATDADGDSITYELSNVYNGATMSVKPGVASAPPYDTMRYQPPYWHTMPMPVTEPLQIDSRTGLMTVVPGKIGRFQIGICCKEWRNGVLINKVYREFQWTVVKCANTTQNYQPYAGVSRTVLVGDTVHFHAKGAILYSWSPATFLSDANSPDAIGTFTEAGDYTYVLYGETQRNCKGYDTITIYVREHTSYTAPNAFTPNGDGLNDKLRPIAVGKSKLKAFSVYNRWGKKVYYTTEQTAGWDGVYNSKEQPTGVYLWMIEYTDNSNIDRYATGNTILIR